MLITAGLKIIVEANIDNIVIEPIEIDIEIIFIMYIFLFSFFILCLQIVSLLSNNTFSLSECDIFKIVKIFLNYLSLKMCLYIFYSSSSSKSLSLQIGSGLYRDFSIKTALVIFI